MFSKGVKEKPVNDNREIIIADAIEALNELAQHYQNTSAPITIKLTVPWVKNLMFGPDEGIMAVIDLTAPSATSSLETHPFIDALHAVKLQTFSHSNTGANPYRCSFYSDNLAVMAQLPEKCQERIEKDFPQAQGLRF